MLAVQRHEVNTWNWLLGYSDQRPTLAALDHVRRVARDEGITREQLVRIVAPALRPWNAPLLTDTPASFSLMKLVEAPIQVSRPRSDADARIVIEPGAGAQHRAAVLGKAIGPPDSRREVVV